MNFRYFFGILLTSVVMVNLNGCSTQYHHKISTTNNNHNVVKPIKVDSNHYRVQKGDTLFSIAFANGIDYRTLALINNIDLNKGIIYPGDILLIKIKNLNAKNVYRVKAGDTLFSIARKNGKSVKTLAQINHIAPPYSINVGQLLVIDPKKPMFNPSVASETPNVNQNKPQVSSNSNTAKEEKKQVITSQKSEYNKQSKLSWQWPAIGTIINNSSTGNISGINIAGKKGQDVKAASAGKIVYAGNALRGYGNLIIIKHNDDYLSAYAHNDKILVKELQSVKAGQVIAKMGDTDSNRVNLHFEIRYRGQSVNPRIYLPKR